MKVILWGINYSPESIGIAPFNTELAEFLAGREHDVSVVTGFSYYPHWRKRDGDRGQLYRVDDVNGITVYRCAQYVPRHATTLRRILHEFTFGLCSLFRVLCLPRADVYVVISPPLFLGVCGWLVSLVKRSRYVFHVQDLQPGAAVGLGMVKGRTFIRMLYALERIAYRHAAAVSGISDAMLEEFRRKGVPAARRLHLPNWLRMPEAVRVPPGEFRRRFDIPPDNLLAVYSGNLGRKQGIQILLAAAARLQASAAEAGGEPTVTIVIVGAGAERDVVARQVAELGLPQLRFLPLLSEEEYAMMLADADVGLITQARGTGQYFFPSKLLSLLNARVPVVTVADAGSELARAVSRGGFGTNVLPDRDDELATTLLRLDADRTWLHQLGRHTHWVQRFSPGLVLPHFERKLEELVARPQETGSLVNQHEPSRL